MVQITRNYEKFTELSIKLSKIEKLPINLQFLMRLPPETIFETAAVIVPDPYDVYAMIEKCYGKSFLDPVFLKHYGYLINENAEPEFSKKIQAIEDAVQEQLRGIQSEYAALLDVERR